MKNVRQSLNANWVTPARECVNEKVSFTPRALVERYVREACRVEVDRPVWVPVYDAVQER